MKTLGRSIVSPEVAKKTSKNMWLRIICICVLLAAIDARAAEPSDVPQHFVTADRCIACHSNLHAASGEDISIGFDWRATMMANSARDPYWHAAVRREVTDHPAAQAAIEDKCSTCHMPMARFDAAAAGGHGEVFANLQATAPARVFAVDGVSCTVCHQITAEGLGEHASFDGGFNIAERGPEPAVIYGPHDVDAGRQSVMRSVTQFTPSAGSHVQQSELCATCHTLFTSALDEAGRQIGSLPEQVPYQEWLHSEFRNTRSCQSCHMPELATETPIASVLGQPRPRFSQHTFRGGNAFMLGILNKYRDELGVNALPQELDAAVNETKAYLARSATLTIPSAALRGSRLEVEVAVASESGHKLPTAYPSRRAWLHLTVSDAAGAVLFESGAVRPDGAIVGNDNDVDASRFEPHYDEIVSADQVQIYESIMVDQSDAVTTGLLRGLRFIKDNRLLPRGFDKATAEPEVAVHGAAVDDDDFAAGGDRVRYRIELGAAASRGLHVTAELLYQSIGYRWAENLRAYDAAETQRFVRYYSESVANSAVRLGGAVIDVPPR